MPKPDFLLRAGTTSRKRSLIKMGARPQTPGIYRFSASMMHAGRSYGPSLHARICDSAQVPSLEGPYSGSEGEKLRLKVSTVVAAARCGKHALAEVLK